MSKKKKILEKGEDAGDNVFKHIFQRDFQKWALRSKEITNSNLYNCQQLKIGRIRSNLQIVVFSLVTNSQIVIFSLVTNSQIVVFSLVSNLQIVVFSLVTNLQIVVFSLVTNLQIVVFSLVTNLQIVVICLVINLQIVVICLVTTKACDSDLTELCSQMRDELSLAGQMSKMHFFYFKFLTNYGKSTSS